MAGGLFVVRGDLARLAADCVAFSAAPEFDETGEMFPAFAAHVAGFRAGFAALRRRERGAEPGSAFWLDVPGGRAPRGVVVVVSVGDRSGGELAVRRALECAWDRLRDRPGRKLIALPAFLTGLGGMQRERARASRAQVGAARAFLQGAEGVDVAFVAYTEDTYQILLGARRAVGGSAEPKLEPDPALVRALRSRECVLFVGAGVSAGSGLPDWRGMIEELERALGVADEGGPKDLEHFLDVAQWYRDEFDDGARRLAHFVGDRFASERSGARPTLAHYMLAALPAPYLVTTNYDDLLEIALEGLRRFPLPVISEEDVALTGNRRGTFVIKLHGDAAAALSGSCELVLCRDDYDEFLRRRPALAALLEALLLNQTFLFVGYGLRDPDFRAIHSRISAMLRESRRPAFATAFRATRHQVRQWERQRVHLLELPGRTDEDKARAVLALLDRLGEEVAGDPQLFLAPDAEARADSPLAPLREKLLAAGEELAAACRLPLSPDDAARVASVLEFLSSHGWQPPLPDLPPSARLVELYRLLADHLASRPDERRSLLLDALGATRTLDDARQLRRELAEDKRADEQTDP